MMWILIAGLGALMFMTMGNQGLATSSNSLSTHGASVSKQNLPDVDPQNQGGSFDTTYDSYYKASGDTYGVPFALMKAHAIRESNQNPTAYHYDNSNEASYGLMQVEFIKGQNRFASYDPPMSDDQIADGSPLYDATLNCNLAAQIISKNMGSSAYPTLRDVINAYNTGLAEAKHPAPNNYVNDVLKNYETLIGASIA